jgi:hypothetical protein
MPSENILSVREGQCCTAFLFIFYVQALRYFDFLIAYSDDLESFSQGV